MSKISRAGCLGLSPAISAQFTLEMRVTAQNHEKFTKTPYFRGSMSFKVIDVNISKKHVTSACMVSSMSVPKCNHFHARQANSGKSNVFYGVPLSHALVRGEPPHPVA